MLFALPDFRKRYHSDAALSHFHTCDNPLPATCLECQMLKLADGLLSGRYSRVAPTPHLGSVEPETPAQPRFQEGIRPSQFKALIGKGHEEFSTMRQQDSEELLQHLLIRLRAEAKRQGRDERTEATEIVKFGTEQRLQCTECKRVGYKVDAVDLASLPIEAIDAGMSEGGEKLFREQALEGCVAALCATEELADYSCSNCGKKVRAEK
jgi:ubiquitin carboxyl-terminal hydrolase 5/13